MFFIKFIVVVLICEEEWDIAIKLRTQDIDYWITVNAYPFGTKCTLMLIFKLLILLIEYKFVAWSFYIGTRFKLIYISAQLIWAVY